MNTHAKGAAAAMVSAVCFGLMPLITKTIYATGSNAITVVVLRFLMACPFILIFLRRRGIPLAVSRGELGRIILLTLLGYGGTALLYFVAFSRIPSGLTVVLHFVYPVLVIGAGVVFFRQKPTWRVAASVVLCLLGIVLLSGASLGAEVLGMVLAVLSGVTYAFYIVYLDRSGLGSMHPMKLILYMNLIAAGLMLAGSPLIGGIRLPGSALGWGLTGVLSLLISFGAVQLFQIGVRLIGPQKSSILSTFEPLTGVLAGVLIYREPFTPVTALGSVLVLAAVVLTTLEKRASQPEKE